MPAVLSTSASPSGLKLQATVTSKGQITLPVALRERLGLVAGSKVAFVQDATGVHLEVEKPISAYRGILKHLGNIDTTIPKEPDRDFDAIRRGESKYAKTGRPL
jgi:AbrB family looped-hinge helix DNA binding protein